MGSWLFKVGLIAVLSAACNVRFADDPLASVRFDGRLYMGGPAVGYDIEASDLTAAGSATEIRMPTDGSTVYALTNVPIDQVAVMKAAAGEDAPYLILLVDGGPRPMGNVPGICAYVTNAEIGCATPALTPPAHTSVSSIGINRGTSIRQFRA